MNICSNFEGLPYLFSYKLRIVSNLVCPQYKLEPHFAVLYLSAWMKSEELNIFVSGYMFYIAVL